MIITEISYDKRIVLDELRRLVREGKLSMEGRFNDVVHLESMIMLIGSSTPRCNLPAQPQTFVFFSFSKL